jgi:hypothetical protein
LEASHYDKVLAGNLPQQHEIDLKESELFNGILFIILWGTI